MSYLLDTNVISELVRPQPNPDVAAWLNDTPERALHLSVISLGEIRKGVEKLPGGARKERLRLWLEQELPAWFGERCLPICCGVADRWGRLMAEGGRNPGVVDCLLAATALHHDLRLVTRNTADFAFANLDVINPWRGGDN